MPIPAGFKLNGVKTTISLPLPPRAKKAIAILDALPITELLTTLELSNRIGSNIGGSGTSLLSGLVPYREKIDSKLFWGSKKTIAQLRKQIAELAEETNDENQ